MKPRHIVIHCSASPNKKRLSAKAIDKMHRNRKPPFRQCGYHEIIQPDGYVEHAGNSPCRGLNVQGAGVSGGNKNTIHICLIGNTRFTLRQFMALRQRIESIRITYDIPIWEVRCHYQYPSAIKQGKTCPNMEINRIIYWLVTDNYKALRPYLTVL